MQRKTTYTAEISLLYVVLQKPMAACKVNYKQPSSGGEEDGGRLAALISRSRAGQKHTGVLFVPHPVPKVILSRADASAG